jgi:hypothetical protein
MKRFNQRFCLIAVLAFLGLASRAGASPVGTVSLTNCTPGGGVVISATTITWLPSAGVNLGCIATGIATSVSYSGGTFTSGTGTISDLPAGSVNPFMVLAGGGLDFSLSSFEAPTPTNGVCSTTIALASGLSCVTFVGSPFLLTSDGTTTALSLTALGVATDTGDASTSSYLGLFTSQLPVTTAQIAAAIDADGSITSTYSATLVVGAGTGGGGGGGGGGSMPEPSTLALLSVGLAMAGIPRKRFGKR